MKNFTEQTSKSKLGTEVIVRPARVSDAKAILALSQAVVAEDIYQLVTLAELPITVASEEDWIASFIATPDRIILVAQMLGNVVGLLDFCNGHRNRIAHTGEFGMSVAKSFRDQGIGSLLVKALIDWATRNERIEKINLSVHSTNKRAIELYKKHGFEIEGVRKKEIKYSQGIYVDAILMGRFV